MAFALDLIVTLTGLAVFGQHIWALRGHFASDSMTGQARIISVAALTTCLIMIILVWQVAQPSPAQFAGFAVMAGSLAIFWAAIRASRAARLRFAFDSALPEHLVTTGPYRFVRHPFYVSYLLFWLGWALASWSAWALLPLAAMATLYTIAARYEEKLLSSSGMAEAYAAYRQKAGLFWPKIRSRTVPVPHDGRL